MSDSQESQNHNTTQNSSQHSFLRNFTHITIPAEIWNRRDLSIQGKALWAELRSLHCKKHGGCYASTEYLMEFMQLSRRRLFDLFKELKTLGLMESKKDKNQTIRCAIVPPVEYKNEQECRKQHAKSAENCTPRVQKTALHSHSEIPSVDNKANNKEIDRSTFSEIDEQHDPDNEKAKKLFELILSKGHNLGLRSYKRWIRKYGRSHVLDTFKSIEQHIKKNPQEHISSYEKYFQKCIMT